MNPARMLHRLSLSTWLCALALAIATGRASAQQATAADRAAAQGLFDEGRALVAAGQAERACPKLEESQRLDPGVGTQFHLADCYERIGRTASAWTLFLEIAATTRASGQHEREALARQRAAKLAAHVSKLSVVVPAEHQVEGLTIERSGVSVGRGQWGSAVPADPGVHRVRASAPGYEEWSQEVQVPPAGGRATVTVPKLEATPKRPQETPPKAGPRGDPGAEPSKPSALRIAAFSAGSVGIVGLATGMAFGIRATSKKAQSQEDCDGPACDTTAGQAAYRDAQRAADVATVAFVVGGAALGTGVVLYLVQPKKEKNHAFIRTRVLPTQGGGAFFAEGIF